MHTITENYDICWTAEQYKWRIPDNRIKLTELGHFKVGAKQTSEQFEISNLKWQIELYPNGYKEDSKGSVKLYVQLLSLDAIPNKPTSIVVCRTIECVESFSKITNICKYKKNESYGWRTGSLLLKEINQYKTLTFIITVKLLQINYEKQRQKNISKKPKRQKIPTLNPILLQYDYKKAYRLKWSLKNALINKMKTANVAKKFESKILYDMWCLQCVPNGIIRETKSAGEVRIYLQLTGLPEGIKCIKIQYEIYFTELKTKETGTKEFSYNRTWIKTETSLLSFEEFQKLHELNVYVNIKILNEYNDKGNDITMKQRQLDWDMYAKENNDNCVKKKEIKRYHKLRLHTHRKPYDEMDLSMKCETQTKRIPPLERKIRLLERKVREFTIKNRNYYYNDEERKDIIEIEHSISDYSQSCKSKSISINDKINNNNKRKKNNKIYAKICSQPSIDEHIYSRVDSMENEIILFANQLKWMKEVLQMKEIHKITKCKKKKEIYDWICNEVGLMQYFQLFMDNGWDDLDKFYLIKIQHLVEMGIKKMGHRIIILDKIKQLKRNHK